MGAIPGMSSVATKMMRKKIDGAGVPPLDELMETAQLEGVRFVGCRMTVDMMGLSPDDFIDGVEIQTAEQYLKFARNCKINMTLSLSALAYGNRAICRSRALMDRTSSGELNIFA